MLRHGLSSAALVRARAELQQHGRAIVRGAPVTTPAELAAVALALWGEEHGIMHTYAQGSVDRANLGAGVLSVNLEPPEAPAPTPVNTHCLTLCVSLSSLRLSAYLCVPLCLST